jgi:hypothetical protein
MSTDRLSAIRPFGYSAILSAILSAIRPFCRPFGYLAIRPFDYSAILYLHLLQSYVSAYLSACYEVLCHCCRLPMPLRPIPIHQRFHTRLTPLSSSLSINLLLVSVMSVASGGVRTNSGPLHAAARGCPLEQFTVILGLDSVDCCFNHGS